ncbi:MAG TPA: KpsF/GutQ family sugar-phosphate isomerase [Candidatus Eisenbacteria bacterium]|nr:KpsF/GutQ family sugar-phosphate isomerase [Candidatus Eisenbacteria bacterium]
MISSEVLKRAADVLRIEADGITSIVGRLDENFVRAVEVLAHCSGKVVVTGMGKSGLICRKISATLASTGTPSFFLHSADALHGDVGMIMKDDVILAVSNSGETDEILKILPHFKFLELKLVVMTGNTDSTLAKAADVVLDVGVKEEACPLGLAPTASTTAALATGDALAIVLLEHKGFKEEDFALRHPGGILGRRLLLRVEDLMHRDRELPIIRSDTAIKEALFEITDKRLGVTGVIDQQEKLVGIITDGDVRRGLQTHGTEIFSKTAQQVMTAAPRTISKDALASEALARMEQNRPRPITSLFVLDVASEKPIGIIHLHDIFKAGL